MFRKYMNSMDFNVNQTNFNDMEDNKGFADVWGIDVNKYNADADEVEEVIQEVEEGSDGAAEKIETDETKEDKQEEASTDANSDAKGDPDANKDDDEKQVAASEEEGKEDASSSAQETKEESKAEDVDDAGYYDLAQGLVSEDLLTFDEEKEYDFESEAGLKELITETVTKRSEEAINKFKEDLGEEAQKLLNVLEKGGSVNDYVKMEQQIDFANVPLADSDGNDYQKNQMYLVEDWMKVQGYEEEEIKEMVNDYLESGMLKKQATIAQKKLASWQTKQNETLLAQKEKEQAESARLEQEAAENFREAVVNTREIAGFQITEGKAKKLYDYITKKDKDGKSKFDKEDTPENRLLYAYFAMEGFDKEKLSKEVAAKQARSLKKKLSRYSDKNTSPKRTGEQVRRTDQETPKIHWNFGS